MNDSQIAVVADLISKASLPDLLKLQRLLLAKEIVAHFTTEPVEQEYPDASDTYPSNQTAPDYSQNPSEASNTETGRDRFAESQ